MKMTDAEIKIKGMRALSKDLGLVESERFFSLIQRDRFDYTKWRQTFLKVLPVMKSVKKLWSMFNIRISENYQRALWQMMAFNYDISRVVMGESKI